MKLISYIFLFSMSTALHAVDIESLLRKGVQDKCAEWQSHEGVKFQDGRDILFENMFIAIYQKQEKGLKQVKPDKIIRDAMIVLERNEDILKVDSVDGDQQIADMQKRIIDYIDKRPSSDICQKHFDEIVVVIDLIANRLHARFDKYKQVMDSTPESPLDERLVDLQAYQIDGKVVPRHIAWIEGQFSVAGASEEKVVTLKNIAAQYLSDCIEAERGQLTADTRMCFTNVFYAGIGSSLWTAGWKYNEELATKAIDQTLAKRFATPKKLPIISLRGDVVAVFSECIDAVIPRKDAEKK